MKFQIRDEKSTDLEAIYRVHQLAFGSNAEADLVDLLRKNGRSVISLVAEMDGEITGHILFSPISLEPHNSTWSALGLAPLGVMPGMQNKGIGTALVKAGLERCRELGTAIVVVLGHPGFYRKFGFRPASGYGLSNEYQADEAFMALELIPGALENHTGLVKYAGEFELFEN